MTAHLDRPMQLICSQLELCPKPPTVPLNLTNWFAKPKPNPLPPPKPPSGERLKVLHLSDIHIDPRGFLRLVLRCLSLSNRIFRLRYRIRGQL